MALLDIFTGKPAIDAAAKQRAYFNQLQSQAGGIYDRARTGGLDALRSGQAGALGALGTGFDTARGDIMSFLDPAVAALTGGVGQSADALTSGRDMALNRLDQGVTGAVGAYDPLAALGGKYGERADLASLMSENALGLRGAAGNEAATGAFRAGPGYQFQLGQGIDAITRAANAGGMVAGGNVLRESQQFGSGLADQEFDDWLNRLMGREQLYAPMEARAVGDVASGRADALMRGGLGGADIISNTGARLSDLYGRGGAALADVYGTTGRSLADLASRGGLAGADIFATGGRNEADLLARLAGGETGFMGQLAGPTAGTYASEANAALGGSKNIWDAILGGAKLAAGGGFIPSGSYTPWKV